MSNEEELSKIDALIAQHAVNEVFDGPQLRYSAAKSVRYGEGLANQQATNNVPRGGYRCHRCGDAGHFIQDCPQGTGEESGKVRQARGLPKAFLQVVSEEEAAKAGSGAFISAEGQLVVLKSASVEERLRLVGPSNDVAIQRFFGQAAADARAALTCFLCQDIVREPTITPCCGELFCRQCLLKHLDRTFTSVDGSIAAMECPHCDRIGLNSIDLIPDRATGALLSQVLGTSVEGYHGSSNDLSSRITSSSAKNPRRVAQKNFEVDIEVNKSTASVPISPPDLKSRNRRHPNTVLVHGGHANPFFSNENKRLLSEEEFNTWKRLYREALIEAGYGPTLRRRYPDMQI